MTLFDRIGQVFDLPLTEWQVAFLASVAFCLPVLLLRRWIPESPPWLLGRGRTEEAERIVALVNTDIEAETIKTDEPNIGGSRATLREVWRIMRSRYWATLKTCLVFMTAQALFYNFSIFDIEILSKSSAAGAPDFGLLLLALAAGNFIGPILFGFLVDRQNGRRWTMAVGFLASGALLLITTSYGHAGLDQFQWPFILLWLLIFLFASAATSTAYLTTGEQFPMGIRTMAFALVFALSMVIGGVVGEALFTTTSALLGHGGRIVFCLIVAVIMLAAGIVAVPPATVPVPAWLQRFLIRFPDILSLPDRAGRHVA
jgi:MFS family permease